MKTVMEISYPNTTLDCDQCGAQGGHWHRILHTITVPEPQQADNEGYQMAEYYRNHREEE